MRSPSFTPRPVRRLQSVSPRGEEPPCPVCAPCAFVSPDASSFPATAATPAVFSNVLRVGAIVPSSRNGGGGRIRTCEPLRASGFQDHRLQPLGHSSAGVKTAP